ncbi:MAG: prolyl oligopeptidase family serine peptidase [Rhodospirillales bacterium]
MIRDPDGAADDADPYLWLEDVDGDAALSWVRAQNGIAARELVGTPEFEALRTRILSILDSDARIPYAAKHGAHLYNLWQDATNPRGLWRRTTVEEYRKPAPAWETVLDLDALGRQEAENWVWKGAQILPFDHDRALLMLSRGGADAVVVREFDLQAKRFVADGFALPESKCQIAWRSRDEVFVGTDFGPGSLTTSGYPRIVKLWRRGTDLAAAPTLAEGDAGHVTCYGMHIFTRGFERDFVVRVLTFYSAEVFWLRDGEMVRLDKPDSAVARPYRDWLMLTLRDDWHIDGTTYAAGSLLACRFEDFVAGARRFHVLFAPTATTSLSGWSATRDHVLVGTLEDVKSRVHVWRFVDGAWSRTPLPGLPAIGSVGVSPVDAETGDDYWLTVTDYLAPTSLRLGTVDAGPAETLKTLPEFFSAAGLEAEQNFVVSADGTRVPYFLVSRRGLRRDGETPALLAGYGGFEVPMLPAYHANVGAAWLERGGAYAVANIRGGGEYGPRWHQAAVKSGRMRCYEDFAAIARDLSARGIAAPHRLGIIGGSNGGLLVANMAMLHPELFGAVVCQVPLLDMRRYHKLLAGASWIGEYGDPDDPEVWEWLRRWSPYHTLRREARYPRILFTTSTRDDRVHPGHARKMAARMREMGHDILFYENLEGGHGGAADNRQAAHMGALAFTFLRRQLGG